MDKKIDVRKSADEIKDTDKAHEFAMSMKIIDYCNQSLKREN
jgi:hypothetical protein